MKLRALGTRVRGLVHRERGAVRSGRRERTGTASMPAASGMLRHARVIALVLIAVLVLAASLVSFAESYRGLYLWAAHHGITGPWAYAWPLQVDTFVAVGELALFVGMVAPADAQSAALMALKATTAAGNPLSGRQLETRFGLTRAEATRLREMIVTEVKEYAVA